MPDDAPAPAAKAGPAKTAPAKARTGPRPAKATRPKPPPLPEHKQPLVEIAIARGIPSYEAWDMTVDELTDKLKG